MPERDELDRLIDLELGRYAEPRGGLEQRVMAHVAVEVKRSRRVWSLLTIGAALTAALLLFAYFVPRSSHRQQSGQFAYAPATSSPAPVASAPATLAPSLSRAHKRSINRLPNRAQLNVTQRPKLDTFPILQPLTDAELAVIRFAAEAPEADRKTLVAPNQELAEPIRITAIHIPPLPSSEEDTN
jgi:hypothetical protein